MNDFSFIVLQQVFLTICWFKMMNQILQLYGFYAYTVTLILEFKFVNRCYYFGACLLERKEQYILQWDHLNNSFLGNGVLIEMTVFRTFYSFMPLYTHNQTYTHTYPQNRVFIYSKCSLVFEIVSNKVLQVLCCRFYTSKHIIISLASTLILPL